MPPRSKLALFVAAASLAAGALLLWVGRAGESAPRAAAPAETEAAPVREIAPVEAVGVTPEAPAAERESAASPEPKAIAPAELEPEPVADLPPPRDAREEVHLIVQDRYGAPVANAEVRLTGMRTKASPGSHWGSGETFVGRSALDGTVALPFPVWVNDDLRTDFLTLEVRHAEFETKSLDDFAIDPEPRIVVLERGAFLVVSGWIEDPSRVVRNVAPLLTDEAQVPAGSWLPIKDGRLSNAAIPAGEHAIVLRHAAPDGGLWFSEVHLFELAREEQRELHLELHPALALEGLLDRDVPRPVRGGEVLLDLMVGSPGGGPKALRPFRANVREDGMFSFTGLPPGAGQIIGMCEGWVSERVPGRPEEFDLRYEGGGSEMTELLLQRFGEFARIPQSVDPAAVTGVFELSMEPTATLVATLTSPDGAPVEGATVSLWPNVFWKIGYSQLFLEKSYAAVSDDEGKLRIENLPTGLCVYGITHQRLALPLDEQGSRSRSVQLRSGETAELALALVPLD